MTKEEIIDSIIEIAGEDYAILLADGYEDAYIGIARQFTKNPLALYDRNKCIDILVNRDGMSDEEAEEYFQYNVEGAWVGENTPMFLQPLKLNEELEKI
jgi:hypothetical protein